MTLHLIGLGLDKDTITIKAKKTLEKCNKVYLENYTVNFPYEHEELEQELDTKIDALEREQIENEGILEEAKSKEIALLVYGDSLSATTHTQLILSCSEKNIPYKIYPNASILTAVAQTGLQPYKFGKTVSMPLWKKNYEPTSFIDYYKQNQKINAHTLLLIDIDLELKDAIYQLESACNKKGIEIEKIIILSKAGLTSQEIYYETKEKLKELKIEKPYCIILPSKLHFIEEEAINNFKN